MAFFAFTEINNTGAHVLYNQFHQLDHMPENFAIPGVAYGQRWVSPPAYRDQRIISGKLLDPIHYLTHYLFTHPMDQTLVDFMDLGRRMALVGGKRFPSIRNNHITGPHMLVKPYVSPNVRLNPDALPYRPNKGIFLVVTQVKDDALVDEVTRWYDQVHIPDMLDVKGIAGTWWFKTPSMLRDSAAIDVSRFINPMKNRLIFIHYLDEDPLQVTEAVRQKSVQWRASNRWLKALETDGVETLFAGPMQTIIPWEWNWFDNDA